MKRIREKEEGPVITHLGDRERDLLMMLYDMLFVDIDFVSTYIYPEILPTSAHRRIRKLEESGYIKSFKTPRADGVSVQNIKVICLDRLGVEEVEALTGESRWDTRWTKRTPTYIHHLIQLAKMRGILQEKQLPDFQFQTWIPERSSYYQYGQRKDDVIVPDGTVVFKRIVNDKAGDFAYFVEMERSRQRAAVSINKLRRYNEYMGRENGLAKHSIFETRPVITRVCFISANENEKLRLIEHTKDVDTSRIQAVLYTTYDEVLNDPYGEIWCFKGREGKHTMWKIIRDA